MEIVRHQFSTDPFYEPYWEVRHLFLGTFNPYNGQKVNYYYGRLKNQTWPLLSSIFKTEMHPIAGDAFYKLIEQKGIACMDLIHELCTPVNNLDKILGKGYSDSAIINTKVKRNYNTERILHIIAKNPGVKIYSTWGTGASLKLKEWKNEIKKIEGIVPLVSPSLAAKVSKGTKKLTYMLEDWQEKIKT